MAQKRSSTDAFTQSPAKRARTSAAVPAARGSGSSSTNIFSKTATKTDSSGDPYWEISRMRRVTVSTFRGKTLVNVREYYEKDGQELPGKKGISMTLEQFNALIELLPNIEDVVQQKGGTLVRPEYKTGNGAAEDKGEEEDEPNEEENEGEAKAKEENDEEGKPAEKAKKQNIEATSDEEESEEE